MSLIKHFAVFLLLIDSLSSALQCTSNCHFTLKSNSPLEIPAACNETVSNNQCTLDIYMTLDQSYISISFSNVESIYSSGSSHSIWISLSNDGYHSLSYSLKYGCRNETDCAKKFFQNNIQKILNRPTVDSQKLSNELYPLLTYNSTDNNRMNLFCYDSNENVRECGLGTKSGVCTLTQSLKNPKQSRRSCSNETVITSSYISIYDWTSFANFDIRCNRFLCNGPMTLQMVKEILFKYNITKTFEGQLTLSSNEGTTRSLSIACLIFILMISLKINTRF